MRRKKQKNLRRAMRFYRIHHGFRAPYKILVDGNFANAVAVLRKEDLTTALTRLLGDKVRVFTTPCVSHEVRRLGPELAEARAACRSCALHHCGHEKGNSVAVSDCMAQQIAGGNANHFLVATQDRELRRRLMAMPGAAAIFATANGIHLEPPSGAQQAAVSNKESKARAVTPGEHEVLQQRGAAEGDSAAQSAGKSPFKRRKAKGPNPLAIKPKQKAAPGKGQGTQAGGGPGTAAEEQEGAKKKRVRRSRVKGDTLPMAGVSEEA